MVVKKPCACGGTKRPGGQRCEECWTRAQPAAVREKAATARLLAVHPDLRAARVPKEAWPAGRRWCSGCQTFVLLKDCGMYATRCRTCTNKVAHASSLERTYVIRDAVTGAERPFTVADYEALMVLQDGRCASCNQPSKSKRLAVDHDHATGLVRGLLCPGDDWGCNTKVIGKIDRDPDPLAMIERLRQYYLAPPASRLG